MSIRARPTEYRGTRFASTLEADWAATFDSLNWYWEYEPVALTVGAGISYRPDFWLPTLRTWCEVKGPHNERLDKTRSLAHACRMEEIPEDEWRLTHNLVVILRPPSRGDGCMWENPLEGVDMVIVACPECRECGWMDYVGIWRCPRGCRNGGENKFWKLPGGDLFRPGDLRFVRAPRGGGR